MQTAARVLAAACVSASANGLLAADDVRKEFSARCPQYLIIRYDDYSPMPLYERADSSPGIERRLFALAGKYNAKISAGVVPFVDGSAPLRPDKCRPEQSWLFDEDSEWVFLLREYVDLGVVEPALHGFTHRRNTAPGHRPGEFRGQPPSWQREAIRDGKSALARALDHRIDVFIPPWNAWDENTAAALGENDFLWLSPDLHESRGPLPVRAVPQSTADPAVALKWVQHSALPARSVLILVTHPFDFEGSGSEEYWDALESLLCTAKESECWTVVGFADLPHDQLADWNDRFATAVAASNARRLLADSIGGSLLIPTDSEASILGSTEDLELGQLQVIAALWLTASALAGIGLAWLVSRVLWVKPALLVATGLLGSILLGFLIWGAMNIHWRGYAVRGIRWEAITLIGGGTVVLATQCLLAFYRGVRRCSFVDRRIRQDDLRLSRAL